MLSGKKKKKTVRAQFTETFSRYARNMISQATYGPRFVLIGFTVEAKTYNNNN